MASHDVSSRLIFPGLVRANLRSSKDEAMLEEELVAQISYVTW